MEVNIMSYWRDSIISGGSYRNNDRDDNTRIESVQVQKSRQDQDQDQDQKSVFKEIGNVNIKIENDNIAVIALIFLDYLSGLLDPPAARSRIENLISKPGANPL